MTIDAYTRNFKAKIDVCEAVGSAIGASDTTTKLACSAEGEDYSALVMSDEEADTATLARMQQLGQDRYLAALHFEGLNKARYGALQKRVHEAFLISGNDTMPTRIDQTILMASQHDMERGQDPSAPGKTQTGVVCAQQGTLAEHAGDDKDLKAVVLAQGGGEERRRGRSCSQRRASGLYVSTPSARARTTTTTSTVARRRTKRRRRRSSR